MRDHKLNYPLYYFVQLTWGCLQNALGFLLRMILLLKDPKRSRGRFYGTFTLRWKSTYSLSLGMFLFLASNERPLMVHEFGHSIQSCILGPFYLPLIGIPSFLWANSPYFQKQRKKGRYRYSSFYPEKWANYLGRRYTRLTPITY